MMGKSVTTDLEAVQTRRALLRSALVIAGGAAVTACGPRGVSNVVQTIAPPPVVPVPQVAQAPQQVLRKSDPLCPAGIRPDLFRSGAGGRRRR